MFFCPEDKYIFNYYLYFRIQINLNDKTIESFTINQLLVRIINKKNSN